MHPARVQSIDHSCGSSQASWGLHPMLPTGTAARARPQSRPCHHGTAHATQQGSSVLQVAAFDCPASLSREEILFLRDQSQASLPAIVADVMRRKLLRRAQRQKTHLSLKDLEEIERRAGSAYGELKEAHHFEYVI